MKKEYKSPTLTDCGSATTITLQGPGDPPEAITGLPDKDSLI